MYSKHSHRPRRTLKMFLVFIGLIVVGGVVGFTVFRDSPDVDTAQSQQVVEEQPVEPESTITVEGRYLFSGTVVLARAVEHYATTNGARDFAQPFSKFDTLNHSEYDAWLADLECPVTDDLLTFEYQVANTVFNCNPAFLPELVQYIEFVNLANNHTNDFGAEGFATTQDKLTTAGIQHVGSYDPGRLDDICEVMGLPVRVMADGAETTGWLPVAFCAWNYFLDSPESGELEAMDVYANVMPVFAFQHSGAEYVAAASSDQSTLARELIDLGAEFVIGNSPHWVQNTEVYDGKLIVYSTGNFIFDQLESETNRGASFDLTMTIADNGDLQKWLDLGESCIADNDDCLQQATTQGLQKLELDVSWDIVASVGGAREVTEKASEAVQAAVEERANWTQTLAELTQSTEQ